MIFVFLYQTVSLGLCGAYNHSRFGNDTIVLDQDSNHTADINIMTSSNGNIFSVTGTLYGEFIGHRWIPSTKASYAELSCFLWSGPK